MSLPDRLNNQGAKEAKERLYDFLALKREEIPIRHSGQYPDRNPIFVVPIHSEVFRVPLKVSLDEELAREIFDKIWPETVEDLENFIADPENKVSQDEEGFLGGLIADGREFWRFQGFYEAWGVLLAPQCRPEATVFLCQPTGVSTSHEVNFSLEKARAYGESFYARKGGAAFTCLVLSPKNLDNLMQAFLLRNWCIAYHNRLLKTALNLETSEPTPVL